MSDTASPPADSTSGFSLPDVKVGMSVEIAFDQSFNRPMLGTIQRVKSQTVDVLLYRDRVGPQIWPAVRHRDDPFLLDHPENYRNGVYVLAASEQDRIDTGNKVEMLMGIVKELSSDIAALKQSASDTTVSEMESIPASVRRKPGRPPRQLAESAT